MGLAACQAHLISAFLTISGSLYPVDPRSCCLQVQDLGGGGRPQSFWLFTDVDASAVGDIIVEWAGRS